MFQSPSLPGGHCSKKYGLVHVHGFAKVGEHLFRTPPAGFLLIGVAGFTAD